MPDGEETAERAEQLANDAATAWTRSRDVMAQVVRAAKMCAETEDMVAETLDHLTQTQPYRAARLRARSASARDYAAHERQWAKDHEPAAEQPDQLAATLAPLTSPGHRGYR
jgi:hypothetical protein